MSQRRKKIIAVILICLLAAGCAAAWKYIGTPLIRFISEPDVFRDWVDSHGIYSRLAFLAMVIFQIIIAVIPGEPFEIAAGYAFGAVEGTLLTLLGAAIGSILTFGLVRRLGLRLIRVFFSDGQINSVRFLKSTEKRDFIFLIIYMLPGTPKDLLGYVAGITDIRFPVFLLICTLGRIPSVVSSTVGGDALGSENYWAAAIIFAATLVVSAGGLLLYNHIRRRKGGS